MHRFLLPVILMATFCAISCGRLLLPPLEITSVSPGAGVIDFESVSAVEVSFSANPTPESAERAFSLSEDGSRMDGALSVTGNVLRFIPRTGFRSGKEYSLTVGDTIETRDGLSLRSELTVAYTTRAESVPPTVIAIEPANGAEQISAPESVTIRFSEPVTKDSLARALSVSPSISKTLSFSDDGVSVTLMPTEPFAPGTRYVVKVSDALRDRAGNALEEEFVSSFLCGTDRVAPSYAITVDSIPLVPGIPLSVGGSDCIRIQMAFDEPLPENAAMGKIVVQPPLKMDVRQESIGTGTIVTIEIGERPVWGKKYALLVKKGIADESGNRIEEDAEYSFVRDGERYRPLTPIKAYFDIGRGIAVPCPRYRTLSPMNQYDDLILPAEAWPVDEGVTTRLFIFARGSSESTGITRVSAMRCASFETTNSCMTAKMTRIETGLASGDLCEPVRDLVEADADLALGMGKVFVIKVDLEIVNRANRGLIKIGVDKGLRDGIGNETESDWSVTLDKS
ncbi:MAG TPA: Ig-like domain-containing protein [Treponemataceae bacterium]|nr:Ig-like domain-containing protein [Treponemataceae bacterium]